MTRPQSLLLSMVAIAILTAACGGQEIEWQKNENALVYDSPTVPTCADLGKGAFSLTINPVTDGAHAIDANNSITLTTFSNKWFNWVATIPMGAVIVPGGVDGGGAKVYEYSGDLANAGLSGPIDPTTNQPFDLTEVTFCYDLGLKVALDTHAKATRTKTWDIKKSVSDSTLTLSTGQSFLASYTVVVSQIDIVESDWRTWGDIKVTNPTSGVATVSGVTVVADDSTQIPLTCPVSFPTQLQPGSSLTCTYNVALPDNATRILVGTATTSGAISGGSEQRILNFAYTNVTYLDSCVSVSDSLYGFLGQVCYNEAPKTFRYMLPIGAYDVCGAYQVVNTAKLVTNDTGVILTSSATVDIDVPCGGGCTLTPGYWKTHSSHGPAPYDSTWATLPQGADTIFYLSGASYLDVLLTPPKGDAYFILAHAFIAAQLNQSNSASTTPAVAAAYQAALSLLQAHAPGIDRSLKNAFIAAATVLDEYNNGIVGPGHCSE